MRIILVFIVKFFFAAAMIITGWFLVRQTTELYRQAFIIGVVIFIIYFKLLSGERSRQIVSLIFLIAVYFFTFNVGLDLISSNPMYLFYGTVLAIISDILTVKFLFLPKKQRRSTVNKNFTSAYINGKIVAFPLLFISFLLEVIFIAVDIHYISILGKYPLIFPEVIFGLLSSGIISRVVKNELT